MPKMKSKRGASKRFKISGGGDVLHAASNRRHILIKKAKKRKKALKNLRSVSCADKARVIDML